MKKGGVFEFISKEFIIPPDLSCTYSKLIQSEVYWSETDRCCKKGRPVGKDRSSEIVAPKV